MKPALSKTHVIRYTPPEIDKEISVTYFERVPDAINSKLLPNKNKILLVADANLGVSKIRLVTKLLQKHVKNVKLLELPFRGKNLDQVKTIWESMVAEHPDAAVALGGGTTCDLVGFASSCYHRGFEHIFIPTTLLGMVDACVGGKTGIDFGGVKNSIGRVHYAVESYCILPFLKSLPDDELKSGISEIIKAAMLFDASLFKQLGNVSKIFEPSKEWLEVIAKSAGLKAKMSEQPLSQRSKLLYGHNIGHGLETYDHKHRRHGDAVSIGMNYELAMAVCSGIVKQEVWKKQSELLRKFNLVNTFWKGIDLNILMAKMKLYKLSKDGNLLFVIPQSAGKILETKDSYYWQVPEKKFIQILQKAAIANKLPI